MIGSLRGVVLERSVSGEALIEVSGVGYRVMVGPRALGQLAEGDAVFLHVHHHIREDAQLLYGFLTRDERGCFETLIGTHGVGPALALAILTVHEPNALRAAVASADLAALCLVPGVGKKTAERLLVELKSRFDVAVLEPVTVGSSRATASPIADVREALIGLGYGAEEIREVLRELPPDAAASDLLRSALGVLGARHA
ncbi:MAG: holliday junction helicase RuvA [Acidimicrobiaceae bacterium]|jgi:Holliday junction DNA helicase RuvA|nr:holliday junction helicase RuvA [Acidimicrobiaceae bacterium]